MSRIDPQDSIAVSFVKLLMRSNLLPDDTPAATARLAKDFAMHLANNLSCEIQDEETLFAQDLPKGHKATNTLAFDNALVVVLVSIFATLLLQRSNKSTYPKLLNVYFKLLNAYLEMVENTLKTADDTLALAPADVKAQFSNTELRALITKKIIDKVIDEKSDLFKPNNSPLSPGDSHA